MLATIKIQGHAGHGAQPELTVAIVIVPEKKGWLFLQWSQPFISSHSVHKKTTEQLEKHFRPLIKDFFDLERLVDDHRLKVYGVAVPVSCNIISDGKILQQLVGKGGLAVFHSHPS